MALTQVKSKFISSDFRISIWHDLATDFCARTRKSEWAASSHFSSHLSFFFTFCSHSFTPRRLLFLIFPNALRLTKPVLITIQASSHRILQDSKPPSLEVPRRDARSVNNLRSGVTRPVKIHSKVGTFYTFRPKNLKK